MLTFLLNLRDSWFIVRLACAGCDKARAALERLVIRVIRLNHIPFSIVLADNRGASSCLGETWAIELLSIMSRSSSTDVRAIVAMALGPHAENCDVNAIAQLERLSRDIDKDVRRCVAEAYGYLAAIGCTRAMDILSLLSQDEYEHGA